MPTPVVTLKSFRSEFNLALGVEVQGFCIVAKC